MGNEVYIDLLTKVSAISKKYENIAEITGENFNVFNVLKLTTNEVRTHSAFLAELLNPRGLHGQGAVFLQLFVNQLKERVKQNNDLLKNQSESKEGIEKLNSTNFSFENTDTKAEKHIGVITEDGERGGYIDILVTDDKNHAIIIENKIYAGDQENQLLRYFNYGLDNYLSKEEEPQFDLLYLTLDGKEPSEYSTGKPDKLKYITISYKDDIKVWLEQCKEKAVNKPLLRETLAQYINLIKQLTGQTMNDEEKQEIAKIIVKSEDSIKASFDIADSIIHQVKIDLINKLIKQIKVIAKEKRYDYSQHLNFGEKDSSIFLKKDNKQLGIVFGFDTNWAKGLFYGLAWTNKENKSKEIEEEFGIEEKFEKSDHCPYYLFWDEYRNWDKNVFVKIADNTFIKDLQLKIIELEKKFKGLI